MTGKVSSELEALVSLDLIGPDGVALRIDAVLDTGFSGFLSLPFADVERLGLSFEQRQAFQLAGGILVEFDI